MEVHDLDVVRMSLLPLKADSILLGNANAVLAAAVTLELFEIVTRQDLEVLEHDRSVEDHELAPRVAVKPSREDHTIGALEHGLGLR
jgi:hypothetical protein